MAAWAMAAIAISPADAQLYAECCPNEASLQNFEWASITPGTIFAVENEKLRISNITFNWNMFLVDKDVWKDFRSPTDFTVEATFSDIVKGEHGRIGWLYVVARFAQDNPASYNRRLDMIKWTLDEEGKTTGYTCISGSEESESGPCPAAVPVRGSGKTIRKSLERFV